MARRRKIENKTPIKQQPKLLVRKSTRQKAKKQHLADEEDNSIVTSENTSTPENFENLNDKSSEELIKKVDDSSKSKLLDNCANTDVFIVNIENNLDTLNCMSNSTTTAAPIKDLEVPCDKPILVNEIVLSETVTIEDEIEETTIYEEMEIETDPTVDYSIMPNKDTVKQVLFIHDPEMDHKITNDPTIFTSENFDKSVPMNIECKNSNNYQMVEKGLSGLHVSESEIVEYAQETALTTAESNCCQSSHTGIDNVGNEFDVSQSENKKNVRNVKAKKCGGTLTKGNKKENNYRKNTLDRSIQQQNNSSLNDVSAENESKEKRVESDSIWSTKEIHTQNEIQLSHKNSSTQNQESFSLSEEIKMKNECNLTNDRILLSDENLSEKDIDSKLISALVVTKVEDSKTLEKPTIEEHSVDSEMNIKMDYEDAKISSSSENSSDTLLSKTSEISDLNSKSELDKQCEINNEKIGTKSKSEDNDLTKSESGSNHSGVRRSNRIKHIGLQKQRSRGRGLVVKPTQDSQKVVSCPERDNLLSNTSTVPEQPVNQITKNTNNLPQIQSSKENPKCMVASQDNLSNEINGDSNANKPVKVKSRWRRSSELEMSNCSSWSAPQANINISFAGSDIKTEDRLCSINSSTNTALNCNADSAQLSQVFIEQEFKETSSIEDRITPSIYTDASSNNLSSTAIIPNNVGAKVLLPMVPEVDREMEERLSQFEHLRENLYLTERYTNKETKRMVCDCFLTEEEIERGELGCGEDCLNRLLMIECGSRCIVGDRCTNRRFQNCNYAKCEAFRTEKKGFGLRAIDDMNAGDFIMEYVGEVVDSKDFRRRAKEYSKDKNRHYYFMALKSDQIIDATMKGNISRFINHSCEPNAETQKWTVNGELRIGFFTKKFVAAGEEITFDYHFQRYGKEAQKCFCEAANCRGWIGDNPEDSKPGVEYAEDGEDEDNEDSQDSDSQDSDSQDAEDSDEESSKAKKASRLERQEKHEEDSSASSSGSSSSNNNHMKRKKPVRRARRSKREDNKAAEHMEDEDLEEQIERLCASGLKNRAHTLMLSRLMVRCRELQHRSRLLEVIRSGEQPCRRLFLDYHGLRLMWSYMMDVAGSHSDEAQQFRLEILRTLTTLPIPNRSMLMDSKVLSVVDKWTKQQYHSPSADSPEDEQCKPEPEPKQPQQATLEPAGLLSELAGSLLHSWSSLKEVFRIPKKERLEQMKEHEREADRGYKEDAEKEARETPGYDRHRPEQRYRGPAVGEQAPDKRPEFKDKRPLADERPNLVQVPRMSKFERRQLFALKVAKEEEQRQRRQQEELWQQHQSQCLALGLDPYATAALDPQSGYPLFFDAQLAQWQAFPGQADPAHVYQQQQQQQQPQQQQPQQQQQQPPPSSSFAQHNGCEVEGPNAEAELLPPPALDLPPKWKWARDKRGRTYYYHTRERVPQWLPPPPDHICLQPDSGLDSSSADESSDESVSSRDNDDEDQDEAVHLAAPGVDDAQATEREQSSAPELEDQQLLVTDDDDKQQQQQQPPPERMDLDCPQPLPSKPPAEVRKRRDGLVQERIISPRREEDRVDHSKFKELKDKLRRQKEKSRLKDHLPSDKGRKHRRSLKSKSHAKQTQLKSFQTITSDMSPASERKIKDTFRINMAHVMVHFLNPYRKNDCKQGRITNTEDFKYLARKLTHFVLAKELKHCKSVDELECNENVKHKAKDFVRKYMNKFGAVYQRDKDED